MNTREYLQLRFRADDGRRVSINIPDPEANLAELEVTEVMDTLIANTIFKNVLVSKDSAVIITTTRDEVYSS